MSTPGTVNFPTSLDDVTSLFEVKNNASTTLNGAVAAGDATITVAATASFPSTGAFTVDSEIIYYTGKTSTTFTGCIRGGDGTSAASHLTNATVNGTITARHLAVLRDAIIAIETNATGKWTTPAFSAGNFTGQSSMTWTVDAGDVVVYQYFVDGKRMTLNVSLFTTSVGGTPNVALQVAMPAGFTSAKTIATPSLLYQDNGGAFAVGFVGLTAASATIKLFKIDVSVWTASTNLTRVEFSITLEIQ